MYTSLHCPDSLLHRSTLVLSEPTFKLQGSPSQWYLTCFPWGQLRRRVDRVHLLTSVPPHSNFLLSTIFSSNALQSPPLPPPRSPNIEFVSFPANSRVVNAQRIHDNILCVLLLQPYKLWLFCRICLLVRPDSDFQVLILKYFLTPLKLLICTLYENCYPILLNFPTLYRVTFTFWLLVCCFFFLMK